jgi:hypothetical protein
MKIKRRLSKMFFKQPKTNGHLPITPHRADGRPIRDERPTVTLRRTSGGWPRGRAATPRGRWTALISPEAHAKLLAWDAGRKGLELSGWAALTEKPKARPDEDKVFFIDDILLVCDIQESSGGYTEMTPQQHYQGMKWVRDMGRSANQLVWWH